MQIPTSNPETALAWAFVVEHATTIRRYAAKFHAGDLRFTVDDLHHDLIEDVVLKFHTYNPSRSGPSTWLYLRARKAAYNTRRALSSRPDMDRPVRMAATPAEAEAADGAVLVVSQIEATGWGSSAVAERRALLSRAFEVASPKQAEAMVAVLSDWDGSTTRERLGCSMSARNNRIRSLSARLNP